MELIKKGEKAPDFFLKDKDGKAHRLKNVKAEYVVLYFYPKDNTPGCTIEAQLFNRDLKEYDRLNAKIIGISGGDEKSKTRFCNDHGLNILLLSDTDFKIAEKYGVYGEKSFIGNKYMGISRVTFILDKNKNVIKVFTDVKPLVHSKEVLEFLKSAANIKG